MSDRSSLLGRAAPLVVARLISAGVTFSIPLVLARWLTLDEYGTYKQLFLVSQTLYYVLPFGMAQSLYFFVPRAEEKRPYFTQTLLFMLFAGCLSAGLLFAFADDLARYFQSPGLLAHRTELVLYTAFVIASWPLEISLTSRGRTRDSAVAYLVSDAVKAAALILPIILGGGLSAMMLAMVAFAAARALAAWWLMLGTTSGPLFSGRLFANQLLYAAPFGAAMLLNFPQQSFHQYFVSGSVTPELFALYAVGCFQLPLVDLLYTPTSEVLMVRLGELDKSRRTHEAIAAFREAATKLAYAFLPMAAFLFAAAPDFIAALFGPKFQAAVPIFRVSVLGVVLAILPMDGTLRARNQTRALFVSYLVKAAVTVPAVVILVRLFGMMGGIVGWALAEVVGKATLLWRVPAALSTPERRVHLVEVIPWGALGRASLAAVAAAVTVVLARVASPHLIPPLPEGFIFRAVPLAIAGGLFVTGYLVVLRLSGVRPEAFVLAMLRRRRIA